MYDPEPKYRSLQFETYFWYNTKCQISPDILQRSQHLPILMYQVRSGPSQLSLIVILFVR